MTTARKTEMSHSVNFEDWGFSSYPNIDGLIEKIEGVFKTFKKNTKGLASLSEVSKIVDEEIEKHGVDVYLMDPEDDGFDPMTIQFDLPLGFSCLDTVILEFSLTDLIQGELWEVLEDSEISWERKDTIKIRNEYKDSFKQLADALEEQANKIRRHL